MYPKHSWKIWYPCKDFPISLDTVVFFCGVCSLPGKMMAFFFVINELTGGYFQRPRKLRCFVER